MRLKRLFLLGVYTVSVSLMGSAPIVGAELVEPILSNPSPGAQGDGLIVAERSHSPESSGSISSEVSEYDSAYIHSDSKGVVTIRQKRYPVYRGDQILWIEPKIISPMMIDENDMPYHIVSWDEADGPLEPAHIETIVDDSLEPFRIILPEVVRDRPYSSCGRLTMLFPKSKEHQDSIAYSTYLGSGAAIDKNIVITAAHNILPSQFNHQPNVGRVKAEMIKFEHMLITARVSTQGPVAAAKVSTHCFIHPEWEKNFDPRYDVALIFLYRE